MMWVQWISTGCIWRAIIHRFTDGDMVAAAWTGTLAGGPQIGKGLSLYRTSGGLLRSTRHALIATTSS